MVTTRGSEKRAAPDSNKEAEPEAKKVKQTKLDQHFEEDDTPVALSKDEFDEQKEDTGKAEATKEEPEEPVEAPPATEDTKAAEANL